MRWAMQYLFSKGISKYTALINWLEGQLDVLKKLKLIRFLPCVFFIIYGSVSWVNHYFFRTHALDLGAYTNALYDYAHFEWNDSLAFKPYAENLLSDHFDLYLILFSPLIWIFGTYTLLVVQVVFLVWAGTQIRQLLLLHEQTHEYAWLGMLIFYLFFGIYSALSFDYHSNVIATCMVPAFILAISKNSLRWAWLWLILILVGKENLGLWMIFICLGLILEFRPNKRICFQLLGMSVFSAFWFVLVTGFIMPAYSNNGSYPHFHYSVLGNSAGEALKFLMLHPLAAFELLVSNHTAHIEGDLVKAEFFKLMMFAGLPFLLIRPAYAIMTIPLFFQKLFHDDFFKWGIYAQYAVEFAPLIAIGTVYALAEIQFRKLRLLMVILLISGNFYATRYLIKGPTQLWQERVKTDPFFISHYTSSFPVNELRKVIQQIPPDAIVSCQSVFQPHLALRDKVYQFPDINDAEYVLLTDWAGPYPLDKHDFDCMVDSLYRSEQWHVTYENVWVRLFRLNHSPN